MGEKGIRSGTRKRGWKGPRPPEECKEGRFFSDLGQSRGKIRKLRVQPIANHKNTDNESCQHPEKKAIPSFGVTFNDFFRRRWRGGLAVPKIIDPSLTLITQHPLFIAF